MSPEERNANNLRKLASFIKKDFKSTLKLGKQVKEFAAKTPDYEINNKNPYIYAVALNIQHFYTSLETLFKRVIKELDGSLPQGESWHRELLTYQYLFSYIEN